MPAQTPLIVTTCTAGYHHWLQHLHANLKLLRLDKLLHVCAADAATATAASSMGLQLVSRDRRQASNASSPSTSAADYGLPTTRQAAGTFMTSSWKAAVHYKQHCVWELLERLAPGASVLLVDGDVTFFQDPLPLLLAGANRSVTDDVVIMDDTAPHLAQPYLNSGFMLLRNTAGQSILRVQQNTSQGPQHGRSPERDGS